MSALTAEVRPVVVMDHDPVVAVSYELMRRGSVTPQTMQQVVDLVSARAVTAETAAEVELLDKARALCRLLPWYGGA